MKSRQIKIYVEGGSKGNLAEQCREGFRLFFEHAGLTGRMPRVVACGSRHKAFKAFQIALKSSSSNVFPILLVDSEGPVTDTPWQHVMHRVGDEWKKPDGANDTHLHLMTQVMESWFLADPTILKAYFGSEFKESKLPKGNDLESIPKRKVFEGLKSATQGCSRDKTYTVDDKGRHSFEILGRISPQLVADASPHAKRLIAQLKNASTP